MMYRHPSSVSRVRVQFRVIMPWSVHGGMLRQEVLAATLKQVGLGMESARPRRHGDWSNRPWGNHSSWGSHSWSNRQHGVAVVSGLTPLLCILWSCTTIALWLESCVVVFWFAKCVSESQGLSRNMVAHDSSSWTGIGCTLSVGRNCLCPSGSSTPRLKRAPGWRA